MPIGRFTFSQCGGSPVPQLLIFGHVNASDFLIPPQAFNQYNSLALNPLPAPGGLTLAVGYMDFPASESSASINIPVLRSTPNPGNPTPPPTKPNSVNLVFPQQFYDSFGLLEPAPFMNQPFFYQDGQRVYFVTELFDDTEDFGGIPEPITATTGDWHWRPHHRQSQIFRLSSREPPARSLYPPGRPLCLERRPRPSRRHSTVRTFPVSRRPPLKSFSRTFSTPSSAR